MDKLLVSFKHYFSLSSSLSLISSLDTFDVLIQHVIDYRINVLVHVLEQDREAILDSQLQLFQEIWIVESHNLKKNSFERNVNKCDTDLQWKDHLDQRTKQ